MRVIQGINNVDVVLKAYGMVVRSPEVETTRVVDGETKIEKTRNVANLALVMDARFPIVTSFDARKMNLTYCKREWLWYLGADRFDDSIEKYASAWAKLKQEDGGYNSNYGQYIFGPGETTIGTSTPLPSQFDYVLETLTEDPYSRRASIVLLQPWHLYKGNTDVVCTYAINFTIDPDQEGGGALNMTVMMRSNDVVYGFTNDAFCFSQLYLFMYTMLQSRISWLRPGFYTHFTNSMHVYEKHYRMLRDIITHPANGGYRKVSIPKPTLEEITQLIETQGQGGVGDYCDWLRHVPHFESTAEQ